MNIRPAARIVLLNEQSRLLLFKMEDQFVISETNPDGRPVWFTVGGGLEEGETYEAAAKRELWEETGLKDVEWGPFVWIREVDVVFKGELTRFVEHYRIARMKGTEIHLNHLTVEEKQGYLTHHWWSIDELRESTELIFPKKLAELLEPILEGKITKTPILID
ncbi:NUDIX hydrolase [Laceyella putida]|uniref:NUDIX hydrolase n=1 Tax=Laceyella putida TaxID=110101 RepID=A0ABW2RHQ7_9BACL